MGCAGPRRRCGCAVLAVRPTHVARPALPRTAAFAQQMAKLYNNLGLKMMERRKHEEALGLVSRGGGGGGAWSQRRLRRGRSIALPLGRPCMLAGGRRRRRRPTGRVLPPPCRACSACKGSHPTSPTYLPSVPPPHPQLRKAEALVDNGSAWAGRGEAKRQRMQAVTYNNLGCLFKRRNMPQLALQVGGAGAGRAGAPGGDRST